MKTFEDYSNTDVQIYSDWIQSKTKDDCNYHYDVLANTNRYSVYDILQMKTDVDGDYTLQYVELKGRNYSITEFDTFAVDYAKIYNLQKLTCSTCIPSYLCGIYYPNKKLAIWKIDETKQYNIVEMDCTYSQCKENGNFITTKQMVLLPLDEAKIYSY